MLGYSPSPSLRFRLPAPPPSAPLWRHSATPSPEMAEISVEGWLHALHLYSPATKSHSVRTARLAVAFGERLSLPTSDLQALRLAALLHDIGKIRIPKPVLEQEGPLDDEAWALVQQHPLWGYEIAQSIPGFPREAALAVRHHHEWWDGRGYPDGLQGAAIPLLARILALADAWDALQEPRPYRSAYTADAAWETLLAARGTQFDPHLTPRFLAFAFSTPWPNKAPSPHGERQRAPERAVCGARLAN